MKPKTSLRRFLALAGSPLLAISVASAATYYWDSNSTTDGFGNATGTWGTNAFWTETIGGGAPHTGITATTNTDTVNFGTATLNYANGTVGVAAGGVTVGGIVMGAGQTTAINLGTSGNAITIHSGGITKNAGSAQLSMVGPIILGAAQTWTNNSSTNLSTPDGTTNFINNGGFNLTVDGTGTTVFGVLNPGTQSLSGSGALIKNGTGTLQIGGNNTGFSGDITVNGGTLYYGDNVGALGTGNINITNGIIEGRWDSPLSRNQGTTGTTIQITGGVSGFSNSRNQIFAMGASATWGSATFNPTEFVLQGSGTGSIRFSTAIDLNGADRTIRSDNANAAAVGNFTGVISGTGAGIIKVGVGHQLFENAANSYSGATTINAGILTARVLANGGSNSSIGSSSNAASNLVIGNGATFRYDGSGHSTNRSFTINGTADGHGASLDASGSGAANLTNTASPAYGTVDQTRTLTLTGTNTGNNTLAANIANNGTGAVSINKTGAGLWVLSGTSNYSGPTTLNAGTLSVSAASNLGNAASNLVFNGGTLQISNTTNLPNFAAMGRTVLFTSGQTVGLDVTSGGIFTVDQVLNQGAGGLTKAGVGTLVINSAHTYTGVTTISAGTLQLGSGTATGSLSTSGTGINIASGATFAVNQSDTATQGTDFNTFIQGSGSLSNVGVGSLVLKTPTFHTGNTTSTAGNITLSHQRAIQFSALNTTGAGSFTLSGTGASTPIIGGLANSGTTRNLASVIDSSYASVTNLTLNPQSGSSFTYGGVIANGLPAGMSLTKTGAGTQTLTGANTYTGATNINGGTLNLGGATATGSLASTVLNLGGGTLSYTRTGTNTQAFTTTNVTAGANSVTASLATQTINMGSLAGRVVGSTLDVGSTGTITTTTANDATGILGGWATITNNNWAVSSGSGLDITGLATFYTTSTGGTTAANYAAKNIDIDSSPTIVGNINANTIRFNSNSRVLTLAAGDNIFAAGGILVNSGVTGSQITGGNLLGSSGGDLIVHGHGDLSIGSLIKNNGTATALTKSGAGTLTLSGPNTFSGGVFINGGTLQIASAANLGDSANVVTFAGTSTLEFLSGTTLSQGFAINPSVTGTLRAGNATVTIDNSLAGSGTLTAIGGGTGGGFFTFTSTNNTFSGDILIYSYSGASYSAGLTMNSLADTPGSRIRLGDGNSTPAFNYGAGAVVPLVLNNRQIVINASAEFAASLNNNATNVNSTVTVNTDLLLAGGAGSKHFGLGGSNVGNNIFAGAITNGAGYVTSLTKAGGGNWILSNTNNSYTGTTSISGGTLLLTGALTGGGAISTSSTGILNQSGSGVISGASSFTQGSSGISTLSGVNTYSGPTTLTAGTLSVSSSANLGAAASNLVFDGGTLRITGTTLANFSGIGHTVIFNATKAVGLDINNVTHTFTADQVLNQTSGGGLTKAGAGTLVLNQDNTYTGATTVNLGVLRIGHANALGTTAGATTVNAGGVLDLAGFSLAENMTLNGTGQNGGGALRSSNGLGTLTGTVALGAATTISATSANPITINNGTGITGSFTLLKTGNGTLTVTNTTTTSPRTAVTTQIDAGTLRLQSTLGTIAPVGNAGAFALNGGTLSLGFDASNNVNTQVLNVMSSSTIVADRMNSGAGGITHTLGALTIGGNTLTVQAGSNFSGVTPTVGLTLGAVTVGGAALAPGNPIFDVQSTANAATTLTLGALSDQGIAPRTWTFQNGSANASTVTLGSAAGTGMVDGTLVNVANTTGAVNVNLNNATSIGSLAQVTVATGNTLTLGANQTFGSLAGAGTVAMGTTTLTIGNTANSSAYTTDFSGVLGSAAAGILVKNTASTLTLSGSSANLFTGATTVNNGTLILNKTGVLALPTTGTVTIGAAAASTAGNATIQLNQSNQIATGATLLINAGGTLALGANNQTLTTFATMAGGTISGSGGTLTLGGGTVTLTPTNSNTISANVTWGGGTRSIATTNATDSLSISGNIGNDATAITKTGLGVLTLSGNNAYTGATLISGGIVNVQSNNALGTNAAGTTVQTGFTLQLQGVNYSTAEALNISGGGFVPAIATFGTPQTGALVNVSGSTTYAGLLTLGAAATISSNSGSLNISNAGTILGSGNTLTLAGAGNGTIGSIIGTVGGGITKNGAGTWTLSGVNTNSGTITINAGTLKVGDGSTGKMNAGTNALTFTGSGTFEYAGATDASTQALGTLTLTSGGGTLKVNAPGSGTNAVTFTSLATVPVGSVLNVISPANTSVTMTGTSNTNGVLASVTGSSGHIFFNGADFAASSSGLIGAASYNTSFLAGDTALTTANTLPYSVAGDITAQTTATINAGIKFSGGSPLALTLGNSQTLTLQNGANTRSGSLLVTGGTAVTLANAGSATGLTSGGAVDLVFRTDTASDSLAINVPITSTTTGGLTKSGAGSVTLGVANAYTGATTINEGTLILGNASAMSGSVATVRVGGVLDLNGQTTTNAVTLNGTGINGGGALINNTGTAQVGAITIGTGFGVVSTGAAIGASIGGSGNITSTGALSGANLLVKVGSGTLTLGTAASRIVGGNTRIDEGTLRLQATTAITPIGTANTILNGGTLSLGFDVANSAISGSQTVTANSTIITDRLNAGAGLTHTLGLLSIGSQTLTVRTGAGVNTASTQGLTFGVTTLTGNPTFDVQSSSTQAGSSTLLTFNALNDQGVAKTITFNNTGTSVTNSQVTLGTAMQSLVDGTAVTLNNGTNAGVTLNVNNATALGTMAQVTVNGNSVLNVGAAQTIGSLAGSGTVQGGTFALTIGNANNSSVLDTSFTGSLNNGSGTLSLVKAGNGTLTLTPTGTSTYSGTTTVSGGVLKLGNANALGSTSGVIINAVGAVDLNGQTTNRNFSGIAGAGQNGGGAIINSSGSLGTITGTSVLTANSSIGGSGNILINNSTGLTGNFLLSKIGNGTLTIANSTTTSARTGINQIDAGTLRLESSSGSSLAPVGTGAFALNGGALSLGFNVSNNSNTGAVNVLANSSIIVDRQASGVGGITHTLGALTMGGSTLTVRAGSNFDGTSPTVGLTLGATTIGGAALAPGNPTFDVQSTANAATNLTLGALSDQGIAPRAWTFQNSGAASSLTSNVTLGSAATSLVDGTIVNVNAGANAGITLNANNATALGSLAQLSVTNNGANVATLNLGAAIQVASLSGNGNITGAQTLTVGNMNSSSVLNTTFSGVIGFGGQATALTKDGFGTLTLTGANTYTGATSVNAGVLQIGNNTTTGSLSTSSAITNNGTLVFNRTNTVTQGADFATAISGSGSLTQAGSGLLVLNGTNTYRGVTVVNAGTLQFAKQLSLYNNAEASWTADNINVKSGATLTVNVDSVGTAGFTSASLNTLLTNISVAGSATAGLQAGAILGFDTSTADGGIFTQGNAITNSTGANGGAIGVTKLGAGTLVFDKANTYTGATLVSGGVLELASSGSTAAGSAVSVSGTGSTIIVNGTIEGTLTTGAGTILKGAGTILGDATISGVHSPGNSPEVQSFGGNLTYVAPDVSVTWELIANTTAGRGTNYDGIDVGGILNFQDPTVINLVFNLGDSNVSWTNDFWASNQSWVLYDYTGGSLSNFNLSVATTDWQDADGFAFNDSIRAGGTFTVSNSGTTVLLNYNAIPEPSTALLSVIGALALLRRKR